MSLLNVFLAVVWVAVAAGASLWGLDYYVLPAEARAYSPLADLFSPTGLIGHGYGVVGSLMMVVGVAGYSIRKRVRFLTRFGPLRQWLQVHIFLCTLGPFLVLVHTTGKIGGLVSIAFWAMTVVVVSGLFGRYVYVRIPKRMNGVFMGMGEAERRAEELTRTIRDRAALPEEDLAPLLGLGDGSAALRRNRPDGLVAAVAVAVREDVRGRRRLRQVRRLLRAGGVPTAVRTELLKLAREREHLRRQIYVLRPFQRLFHYWHVIHLPLAIVMFLILGVHVAVAVLFGYTWIL